MTTTTTTSVEPVRREMYHGGRQWADFIARERVPATGISYSTVAHARHDLALAKIAEDDEQRAFVLGFLRRVRELRNA